MTKKDCNTRIPSLKNTFWKKVSKAFGVGYILAIFVSFVAADFLIKQQTEQNGIRTAKSAVAGYRKALLSGNVRYTEAKIAKAFVDDYVIDAFIRKPDMEPVIARADRKVSDDRCEAGARACWNSDNQLNILYPIYFDSQQTELFGYLDLKVKPSFSRFLLGALLFSILGISMIPVLWILNSAGNWIKNVGTELSERYSYIKSTPKAAISGNALYLELVPIHETLNGLSTQIKNLEDEARIDAQKSMIRHVGHEMRQSVSQLRKVHQILFPKIVNLDASERKVIKTSGKSLDALSYLADDIKNREKHWRGQCQLSERIEENIESMKLLDEVESKNIVFKLERESQDTASISDWGFDRIFQNLAMNAIQASKNDSEIKVRIWNDGNSPTLSIEDHGCGIPEKLKDKIFHYDVSNKPVDGTGLGLPRVKEICDAIGAKIRIKSQEGMGSRFDIIFQPTPKSFHEEVKS